MASDINIKQTPGRRCAFCGEGLTCVHGLCELCQRCPSDDSEEAADDMLECPACGQIFVNDGGGLYCSANCEEDENGGGL
jgi:hypothetical protein